MTGGEPTVVNGRVHLRRRANFRVDLPVERLTDADEKEDADATAQEDDERQDGEELPTVTPVDPVGMEASQSLPAPREYFPEPS